MVSLIGKNLGSILKEKQVSDYREEAVSQSIVKCIQRFKKDEVASKKLLDDGVSAMYVYLLAILQNICNEQLQKWGSINESIKDEDKDECEEKDDSQVNLFDKPEKRFAARLRTELDGLKDDPLAEQFVYDTLGASEVGPRIEVEDFLVKLDNADFSADIKFYIQEYLTGVTFKEMSKDYGGSSDKYRKLVKRALEKITN
tara:strand:+ start:4901 stop:5500 length:600 start_codon:yes stop_codon:yes gene_type:complete